MLLQAVDLCRPRKRQNALLEDSDSDEEPPSASGNEQSPSSNEQVRKIPNTTKLTEWYRVL
ncbi:hypothetical protein PsorP6_002206 [Peronosclerospora sorghi]|uniref:Uncharacterized protein n=1 Tax=Peronosclerospora sorghi TaxID=230839 RepID=A0ACC0WTT4_9STRA|nr:hypothetical protein PsorP6_002206 [Peronosclerospora sorghi]